MGRVCVGRLCYGPRLQWAEFAMGRDVQLPPRPPKRLISTSHTFASNWGVVGWCKGAG